MTPTERVLQDKIRTLRRRVRFLLTFHWVCRGLLVAALISLISLFLSGFHLLPFPLEALGVLFCLGLIAGIVVGLTRRVTPMDVARLTDERLETRERLSSALEFLGIAERNPLTEVQIADAAACSASIQANRIYPLRMTREAKALVVAGSILALMLALPELPFLQSPKVRAEKAALRKEGERIVPMARELKAKATDKKLDLSKRVAQNLEKLGLDMKKGRLTKKQAMVKMNRLSKELQEAHRQIARTNSGKSLDKAIKEMKSLKAIEEAGMSKSEALQKLAEAAKALERKDYDAAARALEALGRKMQSGQISSQETQTIADKLKKMASAFKGTSLDEMAQNLQQAAKQLQEMAQSPSARKQMEQIARTLQKAGGTCKSAGRSLQDAENLQQMAQAISSTQQSMSGDAFDAAGMPRNGTPLSGQGASGGQGNRTGRGDGQTALPFASGPDAGHGTTNLRATSSPMQEGLPKIRQSQERPGMKSRFESIYAPERIATEKLDAQVKGRPGKQGKTQTTFIKGAPEKAESFTPYYEVQESYQKAAEKALNQEKIPAAYRKQVKEYFESLKR